MRDLALGTCPLLPESLMRSELRPRDRRIALRPRESRTERSGPSTLTQEGAPSDFGLPGGAGAYRADFKASPRPGTGRLEL